MRASDGLDKVFSSVGFTLGDHVETLRLNGTDAIDGTGNSLDNFITGNTAANLLNGKAGADLMKGDAGDDTYIVNHVGDQAVEVRSSDGTDLVESSVNFELDDHVENLTLTGANVVNGTGNAIANLIIGNGEANLLDGRGGDDQLRGGGSADRLRGAGGSDVLEGGSGADEFLFDSPLGATNVDTVLDFEAGVDAILLENAVFTGLTTGALSANAFTVGSAATASDHRIVYDPATGALLFDADGSGAGAAVQFATLDNLPASLSATAFSVI